MKLVVAILFLAGIFICALSACVRPAACFNAINPQGQTISFDSIHVNEQIELSAACSRKADSYIWQIQSTFDTGTSFSQIFDETFTDTGQVTISLTVVNGIKSDYATESFKVIP